MVSEDIFGELMTFLKAKKEVTKALLHQQETGGEKSKTHSSYVTGQTFAVQQQRDPPRNSQAGNSYGKSEPLCLACKGTKNPQDAKHWTADCDKWKALKLPDRKRLAKCQRHLQAGDKHQLGKCQSTLMSKFYKH